MTSKQGWDNRIIRQLSKICPDFHHFTCHGEDSTHRFDEQVLIAKAKQHLLLYFPVKRDGIHV